MTGYDGDGWRLAAAMVDLHQPHVNGPSPATIYHFDFREMWCASCSKPWPCETIKALDEQFGRRSGERP